LVDKSELEEFKN
jgi:predicted  nucleic acid-binding Zn-ribbon protein